MKKGSQLRAAAHMADLNPLGEATPHKGSRRPFPKHRNTVLDIIRISQAVPSFPLIRRMHLNKLSCIRKSAQVRIAWSTLFAKAYSLVCCRIPELREIFVTYPRNHLYRHPHSVASLSVHRKDDDGNERLIWGRWKSPETTSLIELQQQLDAFSHAPIRDVFGEGLLLERCPAWFRRLVWGWVTTWSGRNRAKHIGTFSISSVGGHGALNAYHPLVTTSSLAFGPIDEEGKCEVVLICDHRTLDGVLGAIALEMLEEMLTTQIADETLALFPLAKSVVA